MMARLLAGLQDTSGCELYPGIHEGLKLREERRHCGGARAWLWAFGMFVRGWNVRMDSILSLVGFRLRDWVPDMCFCSCSG